MVLVLLLWAQWPSTAETGVKLVVEYESKGVFFEGPTWNPRQQRLYFTAFQDKETSILRLEARGRASVWLRNTQGVNGTCMTAGGRLLGAQAFGHRLVRYDFGDRGPTRTTVLFHDTRLNQPNDVCEAPDGTIYFTDPDFKSRKTSAVYMLQGDRAFKIIDDMPLPNGIKTSPDGRKLYVSDSHLRHWRVYPIKTNGTVGRGKVFFNPESRDDREPDGMTVDCEGNLYMTGRGGVWVANPEGELVGLIPVPEFASNVTFGGEFGRTLFITGQDRVYSLPMKVKGAQFRR